MKKTLSFLVMVFVAALAAAQTFTVNNLQVNGAQNNSGAINAASLNVGTGQITAGYTATPNGVNRFLYDALDDAKSVKDYGAKGDAVIQVSPSVSINSGSPTLTVTGASFVAGDVGKAIIVPGAGASAGAMYTTISARTSATVVTLAANAATTVSAVATSVIYGHDDTAAIQLAVNNAQNVFFPEGSYLTDSITGRAGQHVFGVNMDAVTIIEKTICNGCGWYTVDTLSSIVQYDGIHIEGMTVYGGSDVLGFSEFLHGISLSGVKNTVVENVYFKAFRGDGLYLGTGTSGNLAHNTNVTVRNSVFDGVNQTNRNGVSIIDGSNIVIENNNFLNTTKSTMPGAVDIEPDGGNNILANIIVRNNYFSNIGGTVGVITMALDGQTFTTQPSGFIVENNYITGFNFAGLRFFNQITGGVTDAYNGYGIHWKNNYLANGVLAFQLSNAKGAIIEGNTWVDMTNQGNVSDSTANDNGLDITLRSNLFSRVGKASGNACIYVFTASRVTFDNNEFSDCGLTSGTSGYGVDFNTGTSSSITFSNNNWLSPAGKMSVAIQKEAAHTFTASTNTFYSNRTTGFSNFFAYGAGVQAVPGYSNAGTSYTPVITGASTSGSGTYTTQEGYYSKIGNVVTFQANLVWTAHTGTGQMQLSIPFPAATSNMVAFSPIPCSVTYTLAAGAQANCILNRTTGLIQVQVANAGALTSQAIVSSGTLYVAGSYLTN